LLRHLIWPRIQTAPLYAIRFMIIIAPIISQDPWEALSYTEILQLKAWLLELCFLFRLDRLLPLSQRSVIWTPSFELPPSFMHEHLLRILCHERVWKFDLVTGSPGQYGD
jgi:hypothetical protein